VFSFFNNIWSIVLRSFFQRLNNLIIILSSPLHYSYIRGTLNCYPISCKNNIVIHSIYQVLLLMWGRILNFNPSLFIPTIWTDHCRAIHNKSQLLLLLPSLYLDYSLVPPFIIFSNIDRPLTIRVYGQA
jgi:hypothetical protein